MEIDDAKIQKVIDLLGRLSFPPSYLLKLVSSSGRGDKQLLAFNLCDGTRSQSEIAKEVRIDRGNFSRTIARWIELGIVFKLTGNEYPMHIYPLSDETIKSINVGE